MNCTALTAEADFEFGRHLGLEGGATLISSGSGRVDPGGGRRLTGTIRL